MIEQLTELSAEDKEKVWELSCRILCAEIATNRLTYNSRKCIELAIQFYNTFEGGCDVAT